MKTRTKQNFVVTLRTATGRRIRVMMRGMQSRSDAARKALRLYPKREVDSVAQA